MYVVATTPAAPDDRARTIAFSIITAADGAPPSQERLVAPDGSLPTLAASGDQVLVAWFQQGATRRELSLARRGATPATWTAAVPAKATPIGSPLLAPARNGDWLVCFDTVAHEIHCASVPASGRDLVDWRTIAPLAGAALERLVATSSGTYLLAQCDRGPCKGHLVSAAVDPPATASLDLGVLSNLDAAPIGARVLVLGDRDPSHRVALAVGPDGATPVALGTAEFLDVASGSAGGWLLSAYGFAPWSEAHGLAPTVAWPRELLAPIHGGIQELRAAGPDTVVISGLDVDGVRVIGVRLPSMR